MLIELRRDTFDDKRTFGRMFVDGKYLGEVLEDKDRYLENGGEKVYGQTAIPRGRYQVSVTYSNRFKKPMPQIHDVPGFDGVRIHGGNSDADTLGCPLLGSVRTGSGIANCKVPNERLMHMLELAEEQGQEVWIEIS